MTGDLTLERRTLGLLLACDGFVLLAVAEVLAMRGSAEVFIAVFSRSVIGLTLIADFIAAIDDDPTWVPGVVWLLGFPLLVGTTRRIREISLVYLGIAQLVAGGLALSYWSLPFDRAGVAMSSMAMTAAGLAGLLWSMGVAGRRRGLSDFYVAPCLNACLGLTGMVLALAIGSRLMTREAYAFGVLALALNAILTLLLSNTWRRFELSYAAIFHVVVATYIVLFSVGRNDPRTAYVLGLAAVIEAIVFWGIGFACEQAAAGRFRPYALPLFHATVAMAALGIPMSDRSGAVLALAALAFLLTVKSLPLAEWLYAVVGCLGAACYFGWLSGTTPSGLMASAMVGAFGLWAVGVLVQMTRGQLCDRLGLRPMAYEFPLFHSAIAAGFIALAIKGAAIGSAGASWTSDAWLPISLSMLALLMPRAYPRRGWVHAGLAFLVYGVVAVVSPSMNSMSAVAMAGTTMALAFLVLEQVARSHELAICERLGVVEAGYLGVLRSWAVGLFGLVMALTIAIVVLGMAASFALGRWDGWQSAPDDWWMLLIALGLAAVYLVVAAADP